MVDQELDSILALRAQVSNDVRQLAQHYFLPLASSKPQDPKDPSLPEYMRKLADGSAAVELVCGLVNAFGVMGGSRVHSGEMAIADLTFAFNLNQFWVKNAANLMPIVSAAVNAFLDNQKLKVLQQPIWKELEFHNSSVWLEVLPAILLALKGYGAMREQSFEIKQAFQKFLRS